MWNSPCFPIWLLVQRQVVVPYHPHRVDDHQPSERHPKEGKPPLLKRRHHLHKWVKKFNFGRNFFCRAFCRACSMLKFKKVICCLCATAALAFLSSTPSLFCCADLQQYAWRLALGNRVAHKTFFSFLLLIHIWCWSFLWCCSTPVAALFSKKCSFQDQLK